jgi:type I restriction enzyme S subunit
MLDETITETLPLTDEEMPLPEGWHWVKLKQISSVISKGTTPMSLGYSFTKEGVPFLRAEDVNGKDVDPKTVSFYISSATHSALSRSKLIPGDVVITIAGTLGRVGYLAKNTSEMNCNQAVAFVRPVEEIADTNFVCFACQRQEIKDLILKIKSGGGIPNLNLQQIQELSIPLPPTIEEQRRIAAILMEQMKGVEQARLAVEEQLAAADLLPNAFLRSVFESEEAQNWQKKKLGSLYRTAKGN